MLTGDIRFEGRRVVVECSKRGTNFKVLFFYKDELNFIDKKEYIFPGQLQSRSSFKSVRPSIG